MAGDPSITNLMGMARTAMLGGNNQEALSYFNRVLEIEPSFSEAWIGKGKAAGWQSSLVNFRLQEAAIAFNHAIASAEPDQRAAVIADVVSEMNIIIVALYGIARDHMIEYVSLANSWLDYLRHVSQLIDALETTRGWDPENVDTLENIVHLCKDNIEGYSYRDQFNNNAPSAHGITSSYESFLRERMEQAVAVLQSRDPNYAAPVVQKKTADACFIVTATMGDFEHPDVVLLRRFRDKWIRNRPFGDMFVAGYYRVGPYLAGAIERSDRLKRVCYLLIVRPATIFARRKMR